MKDKLNIMLLMTVMAFIIEILFQLLKKSLIIQFGIRSYRLWNMILIILILISLVIVASIKITLLMRLRKKQYTTDKSTEMKPYSDGVFHNQALRELMENNLTLWNGQATPFIEKAINQLVRMDDLQDRLHNLLTNNDASVLSDTEDVLVQVEQYLCRNLYSCTNFMDIYDPSRAADVEAMCHIMDESVHKNEQKLKDVHEFVLVLTEYINQQHGTDDDTEMLNTYKQTIIKSLREEEK